MKHQILTAPEGMRYTDGEGQYISVYIGAGRTEQEFKLIPYEPEEDAEYV